MIVASVMQFTGAMIFIHPCRNSHKWPPDFDEIVSGRARRSAAMDFSPLSDGVQSGITTQFRGAAAAPVLLEKIYMKISSALRAAVLALMVFAGVSLSSAARADEGFVQLTIYKAGWVIGGSGGSGVLDFRGRRYALSTGGLDYGFVFGGSKTILRGRVSNIWRPSDVAGVYGAAGAGLAVGRGARAIVLTNQKGAVLELTGHQVGLMANADLSGLAITMR
jgi:hypothetical protein